MGGDGGFLAVVERPGIDNVAALRGKTLSVDAMTTGLAFVLRELVARGGLTETDVTYVRAGGTANRYRDLIAGSTTRRCCARRSSCSRRAAASR
jgi:ABC-type nitrate/sulfonate/bicarbonate transport system substrate-binding protein